MPPRPSKRRRTGGAAASAKAAAAGAANVGAAADAGLHAPSTEAGAGGGPPSSGQQPGGELQAACTAERAAPGGIWPSPAPDVAAALRRLALAALLQDRLAEDQPGARRLTDPIGTAGGWMLGPRAVARVEGRRVAGLPAGPGRDAAEAMLYAPGWAGEEWMETGDEAGGFRQLVRLPQFRLGVSRSGRLGSGSVVADVCRAPASWRVAFAAELAAAGMRRGGFRQPQHNYYMYNNQAGWDGYKWGGVYRIFFVTADWETVGLENGAYGGVVDATDGEGRTAGEEQRVFLDDMPIGDCFGGVFFVRDGYRAEDYPVPVDEPRDDY